MQYKKQELRCCDSIRVLAVVKTVYFSLECDKETTASSQCFIPLTVEPGKLQKQGILIYQPGVLSYLPGVLIEIFTI